MIGREGDPPWRAANSHTSIARLTEQYKYGGEYGGEEEKE
jgi:hypothetical protein